MNDNEKATEVAKIEGNGNKPQTSPYRPAAFPQNSARAEEARIKIADKIIDATGDKLKELNILPPGLLMPMVAMDTLNYLVENSDQEIDSEHLIYEIIQSIDHRLRAVKGGLINKAVILAGDEARSNQGDSMGDPNMRL